MSALYLFLFFFFLQLIIPLVICASHNLSNSDHTILLSLKQHWGNPPSLDLWNSVSSPCHWAEVICNNDTGTNTVFGLYLEKHNISGTIPSAIICQLRNLRWINLSNNKLSGRIPSGLYNCSNLTTLLDLSRNELSGTIPGELFLMSWLNRLNISRNRLFGGIPTPIHKAHSLDSIDLSYNNLNGSIPDDIMNLHNLRHLDLSMNSFSGSIPRGLFRVEGLSYISLAYNNFTGELPTPMGSDSSSSLRELNLSHNHIYGMIPQLPAWLYSLDLDDNRLSGDIIQNVFNFSSGGILRLCSNKFFGKIPYEYIVNNHVLDGNCLDRSNLCSDRKSEGLPRCPSNLCSDSRIRPFLKCNLKSHKNSTTIIVGKIGAGVVGFTIFCYLARKCWKKAHNIILPSTFPLNDEFKEWKMVSFHKLDFDKSSIISSLTDENLIGNGGSGKVYRVIINQTGDAVAVKSIWNDKKTDERLEKEFMAEIQTLGNIRHYNIVKLLCYISGKDTQLLVYQYFEKQSLDQWLHDNKRELSPSDHSSITKLDWPMRLNIAIGVAQGLCYMHHHCSPPIIHRDIKSSNILLDSEFNAKIADFGLAKLLSRSGDPETASAVVGTFGYIAPEYAYTKRVNMKSDVYSFGVVLLELTTGRKAVRPDEHMNIAGWAQMHYRETAYIVESLDAEIKESSFLDQIVAVFRLGVMCTSQTPAVRPSMRDCLNILQDYSSCFSSSGSMS